MIEDEEELISNQIYSRSIFQKSKKDTARIFRDAGANSKFLATSSRNETTLDTSIRLNETSRRLNDKTERSRDPSLHQYAHNGSEEFYSSDDESEVS